MVEEPNYLKRLSTHVLSVQFFLRSGSLDDIDASLREHGAVRYGPCWLIDERDINKIDIVGCEWPLIGRDAFWQRYRTLLDWEPTFSADAYVKGWDLDASADALRHLLVALLHTYGGVVIFGNGSSTPQPEHIFTLDDLRVGYNPHGTQFLTSHQ